METKWLIEEDVLESTTLLIDALKLQGITHKVVPSNIRQDNAFLACFEPRDCVVFVGSLPFGKQILKNSKWCPGVYYNIDAFNCTHYYPPLGKYLLNENYIMLPYGELIRRKEYLYDAFGEDRTLFIRPNRGDKLFTGKQVFKEDFEEDVDQFGFRQLTPQELIVVANPQNIQYEWRFIAVEGRIITGSQYKAGDRFAPEEGYPEAKLLAEEIAKIYQPDPVYVVDICQNKSGEFKVMEVGCFSCAGFYKSDCNIIVDEVSKLAWKEYMSYQ